MSIVKLNLVPGVIKMRKVTDFFKTCLLGGLLILLPLLLFYLMFSELMDILIALATPIADLFPEETFDNLSDPLFIAIPLLLISSFLFGLALKSDLLIRFGNFIELHTLMHVPLYAAVKRLSRGLISAENDQAFKSAFLKSEDDTLQLVYVIEDLGDDRVTILVPLAPAGFAGSVLIVGEKRLVRLNASIGDTSKVLAHWGFGMSEIVELQKS